MFLTQGMKKQEAVDVIIRECIRRKISIMVNMDVSAIRNKAMVSKTVDGIGMIRPKYKDGEIARCIFEARNAISR
jgi:hypothetical protein